MEIESLVADDASIITSKMMEIAMERQKVIANNIANADTPGYKRLELDFEKKLRAAVKSGDIKELHNLTFSVIEDRQQEVGADGNSVEISKEMNEMVQNSVLYSLLSKAFKTKMNILKTAIQ